MGDSRTRALGAVMIDVAGLELTAEERERLAHPAVGGVILFARNYESPQQLRALTAAIRTLRSPSLLVAVDHEGGRVQRFQHGFTRLPPMRAIGRLYDRHPERAEEAAFSCGQVLAHELTGHGVDISFAPVLDIDHGSSSVIGDRAFHSDPAIVARLGARLVAGMRSGGMGAVGKHFPGHGFVRGDSHHELPVDERPYDEIASTDLVPFRAAIRSGLAAVMPAHVVYRAVDPMPAGFSTRWLNDILRGELGFQGLVFSDDLSMAGAHAAGGIVARAERAFEAGCDMVLVCNDPAAATTLLDGLPPRALDTTRAALMRPERRAHALRQQSERYLAARGLLARAIEA